jgi:hypothetical protein
MLIHLEVLEPAKPKTTAHGDLHMSGPVFWISLNDKQVREDLPDAIDGKVVNWLGGPILAILGRRVHSVCELDWRTERRRHSRCHRMRLDNCDTTRWQVLRSTHRRVALWRIGSYHSRILLEAASQSPGLAAAMDLTTAGAIFKAVPSRGLIPRSRIVGGRVTRGQNMKLNRSLPALEFQPTTNVGFLLSDDNPN